ncbi:PREDICTED: prostatic spermine-binding protein-like [Wasmannia auropunctata]|uniref:prostatic spermine-binding protein-like n=1 Tax=Wasmannia auropunctata TaxID=64793 RepID=UPI0005EEDA43|nr:PREDICTED: prostatic spermine-binding protein-like [Wasmannia auropunctata]
MNWRNGLRRLKEDADDGNGGGNDDDDDDNNNEGNDDKNDDYDDYDDYEGVLNGGDLRNFDYCFLRRNSARVRFRRKNY